MITSAIIIAAALVFGLAAGTIAADYSHQVEKEMARLKLSKARKESAKLANRIHRQRVMNRRLKDQLKAINPPVDRRPVMAKVRPDLPH